jgi:hypothetical protein
MMQHQGEQRPIMSPFQADERYFKTPDVAHIQALSRNPNGFVPENLEGTPNDHVEAIATPYLPASPLKPASKRAEIARPLSRHPYVLEIEVNCEECGGSGFDPGGIDPWGPEPCPACRGVKTRRITRNYLAEAFMIAANSESARPVERQHLVAVIQHCREAVSALVVLPEVA